MPEHRVGPAEDVPPGEHRVVRAGNREIGVFNLAGEYHAIPNRSSAFSPETFARCASLSGTMSSFIGWSKSWCGQSDAYTVVSSPS